VRPGHDQGQGIGRGACSGTLPSRSPSDHPQTVKERRGIRPLHHDHEQPASRWANLVSVYSRFPCPVRRGLRCRRDAGQADRYDLPGSSATVRYRLRSQRTGAVTATAFEAEDVKGRFILRTGVGERNIPLSPDSLVLPVTPAACREPHRCGCRTPGPGMERLPRRPSGALPSDVLPIGKAGRDEPGL